jgi:predicted nuclease of predicted toxin-antitoxin system
VIRFLFDMGLPRRACDDLRLEGIDAVHLGPLGLQKLPDDKVIELAVREGGSS